MTIFFQDDCEGCQVHNLFCQAETGRMHGFSCHGHFAEYSLSHYRNAMVLPQGMDMISAAPLFCAGVTGKSEAFQIESLTPRIDVLMIVLSLPCGKGLRA